MATEIRNARIKSTMLGREDHGILTCYLNLEGDGWGCGFGGYAFDRYNQALKAREATEYGLAFIDEILKVTEVSSWEKLPGTYIRVDTEGWGGKIVRIGNLLKEQWFDPKELGERFGVGRA